MRLLFRRRSSRRRTAAPRPRYATWGNRITHGLRLYNSIFRNFSCHKILLQI